MGQIWNKVLHTRRYFLMQMKLQNINSQSLVSNKKGQISISARKTSAHLSQSQPEKECKERKRSWIRMEKKH